MTERDTLCEKAANAYRQGNYKVIAGSSPQKMAFKVLERYAGKLARTVLRGAGAGNSPRLPDGMTRPRPFSQIPTLVVLPEIAIKVAGKVEF
jgi:hypothetical protein